MWNDCGYTWEAISLLDVADYVLLYASLSLSHSHIHRNQRWVTIIAPSGAHTLTHTYTHNKKNNPVPHSHMHKDTPPQYCSVQTHTGPEREELKRTLVMMVNSQAGMKWSIAKHEFSPHWCPQIQPLPFISSEYNKSVKLCFTWEMLGYMADIIHPRTATVCGYQRVYLSASSREQMPSKCSGDGEALMTGRQVGVLPSYGVT